MSLTFDAVLSRMRSGLPILLVCTVLLGVVTGSFTAWPLLPAATYCALVWGLRGRASVLLPTVLLPVCAWLIAATGGTASPYQVVLVLHVLLCALLCTRARFLVEVALAVAVLLLPLLYDAESHHGFHLSVVIVGLLMGGVGLCCQALWGELRRLGEQDRLRERERSDREQRFRSLFDHHPDAVMALDLDGCLAQVNDATVHLLGRSADALVGLPLGAFVLADDIDHAEAAFGAVLAGQRQRFAVRVMGPDGDVVRLMVSNTPIVVDGLVVGVFAVCQDISEEERTREELAWRGEEARRMLEQQRLALDAGDMAVWEYDPAADALRWHDVGGPTTSPRFAVFAQAGTAEQWQAMVHPDDLEHFVRFRDDALSTGGDFLVEHRVLLPDGQLAWVSTAARTVDVDADGTPLLLYGVTRDITERRAAEADLELRERRLRQAQHLEALGQLAGGVAHDFNNMLTAILGFAELLELRLGEPVEELHHVAQAGERARKLVNQLLAFSRGPAKVGATDVNEAVQGVVDLLGQLIGAHIGMTTEIDPDIGTVMLEGAQLEQVVLNLAVNARDAMPSGGQLRLRAGHVDVGRDEATANGVEPGRYVRLTVTDTGAGMPPEVLAHMFEPFYTTKPEGEGTGMGLATVYGIVASAGGRIDVDSVPGRGTTVWVDLPLSDQGAPATVAPAALPLERSAQGRVLLVEDQGQIRTLVRQTLTRCGYTVLVATDGRDALELTAASDVPVDLLLTDVVMPHMNGVQLAQRMRERFPSLPVLFMSGYAKGEALREGISVDDGQGFIQKPFTLGALLRDVEALLAHARKTPDPTSTPVHSLA